MSREVAGNRKVELWVTALRILWLLTAILVLVLLVPELKATFEAAKQLCQPSTCSDPHLSRQAARALRGIGMSLDSYATYHVVLVLVNVLVCYVVAAALMVRRSGDRMVLLTAFVCVLFCTPAGVPIVSAGGIWAAPSHVVTTLGAISGPLLLYTFPSGTFVPRWSVALAVLFMFMGLSPAGTLPDPVSLALWLGILLSILMLQVYRYRKVSTPLQRQQTKLVVYGIGLYCGALLTLGLVYLAVPNLYEHVIPFLVLELVSILSPLFILISIGLAVMRHGLWDVDVLINRTLIYVTLTVSLLLVYLASILAIQKVFGEVVGGQSDLAVAISTLLIAALFNPLRRRIQYVIARTFYRHRYDASRVVGAFVSACRDETDLEALETNVLAAVEETMRPSTVSLWLRTDA